MDRGPFALVIFIHLYNQYTFAGHLIGSRGCSPEFLCKGGKKITRTVAVVWVVMVGLQGGNYESKQDQEVFQEYFQRQ